MKATKMSARQMMTFAAVLLGLMPLLTACGHSDDNSADRAKEPQQMQQMRKEKKDG